MERSFNDLSKEEKKRFWGKVYAEDYNTRPEVMERQNKEINCEVCGGKYQYKAKCQHFKTQRHIKSVESGEVFTKINQFEKINCEVCGGKYLYKHKGRHLESKKHKKAI